MNVFFFTNEYPPNIYGGAGVHVDYLSQELKKYTQLFVRCFGEQAYEEANLHIRGSRAGFAAAADIPKELQSVFSMFTRSLQFFEAPFAPDLVHCHTWYSHFAGILAKLAYGTPLVLTTHSLEPLRPWKKEQMGKGYQVSSWVEREALRLSDAIIAVSEGTKADILAHFSVDPQKIHVIPNGIKLSEYRKVSGDTVLKRLNIDPAKPYLLYVGRITRQKGIVHLVKALSDLDPDIPVVLCAGAPDTPEIGAEMKLLVEEAKSKRPNIIWVQEMLSRSDLVEIYSHAGVFCCPSIYEPFGIINLEAMACSVPVVASRTGGIPEIVVPGETGTLVDVPPEAVASELLPHEGFAKSLAAAVNALFRDPALRQRMGIKGRQRVEALFSWESVGKKTFALYESLIAPTSF